MISDRNGDHDTNHYRLTTAPDGAARVLDVERRTNVPASGNLFFRGLWDAAEPWMEADGMEMRAGKPGCVPNSEGA